MSNNLIYLQRKIVQLRMLVQLTREWHLKGSRIAFTNGCFDLLHYGHVHTLLHCADHSDKVVIAINSDASVRRLKGENRPIVPQDQRALMLATMQFVDAVVIFDEDTPLEVIRAIQPDLLVKGGDWEEKSIVGADLVRASGGDVEVVPYLEGLSTTALADQLQKI